jgi:ABC-type Fe3+/spermidine/putrescine transport system ATPase subunit
VVEVTAIRGAGRGERDGERSEGGGMAEIVLSKVSKRFADGTLAVDGVDLAISDGEFVILVGPSGCGKSTTLNMIAGL